MLIVGDVKCYHCGHISGEIRGEQTKRSVPRAFEPHSGYQGLTPKPGQPIRCKRCGGPVYLDDLRPAPKDEPVPIPSRQD